MPRLDRQAFRNWLATRSRFGSVGFVGREDACPLARYLGPGWWVDGRLARRGGCVRSLPTWAMRFVYAVDELPAIAGRPRRVWPRVALELLDGVEAELAADEAAPRVA